MGQVFQELLQVELTLWCSSIRGRKTDNKRYERVLNIPSESKYKIKAQGIIDGNILSETFMGYIFNAIFYNFEII